MFSCCCFRTNQVAATMGKEFTRDEVSKHKSAQSLWIVISNTVYDVTKFIDEVRYWAVHLNNKGIRLCHHGLIVHLSPYRYQSIDFASF